MEIWLRPFNNMLRKRLTWGRIVRKRAGCLKQRPDRAVHFYPDCVAKWLCVCRTRRNVTIRPCVIVTMSDEVTGKWHHWYRLKFINNLSPHTKTSALLKSSSIHLLQFWLNDTTQKSFCLFTFLVCFYVRLFCLFVFFSVYLFICTAAFVGHGSIILYLHLIPCCCFFFFQFCSTELRWYTILKRFELSRINAIRRTYFFNLNYCKRKPVI